MAYSRFTLPALRLTKRPTSGLKSVSSLQRGVSSEQLPNRDEKEVDQTKVQSSHDIYDTSDPFEDPDDSFTYAPVCDPNEPTGHELECKSMVSGWQKIQNNILETITELAAMPPGQTCLNCEKLAIFRCPQCGPMGFFCQECFQAYHKYVNIFHIPERWEDDHYVPLLDEECRVNVRPKHQCSSKREVPIDCLDSYGVEHRLLFTCCECEPVAITLTRANLWPATPSNPRYAFSFALLDWVEALLLECHVALRDFCNALKFQCPFFVPKRRDMYSTLINSFEEYRFLKHRLRHLTYLSEELDPGNICPACPQDVGICRQGKGKCVLAMDALFGLPRKKSAGISHRDALHGELFFHSQSDVDEFVAESGHRKSKPQATEIVNQCSDFLAGNSLRSANRYKALDETAVFGYCCRHEFPGGFINLKHGERLAYAVWMLDIMMKKYSGAQLFVMYDIACTLFRHLKSLPRQDILENCQLCLPTFHSYGHQVACQVAFGPRRCVGIGLSDGETMERLWSYLRRFSRMTKEMRPSHRTDILTSALVYYGIQTKEKLPSLLLVRWDRALNTREVAAETMHQLMPGQHYHAKTVADQVNQWLAKEIAVCQEPSAACSKLLQWQIIYFQTLQNYYTLRDRIASGDVNRTTYGLQMTRLNSELAEMEKKQSLPRRWLTSDKEYKDCENTLLFSKSEQLLLLVWKASQRRMYLLNLKRKYADGQKISKKLCSQICKETKSIKALLAEYHTCQSINNTASEVLTLSEALDPSIIGAKLQKCGAWCTIASGKERQIIDAYLALCRSTEEISMLKDDVENMIVYYNKRKKAMLGILQCQSDVNNCYTKGARAMLHQLLVKVTTRYKLACEAQKVMSTEKASFEVMENDSILSWSDGDSCSSDDLED